MDQEVIGGFLGPFVVIGPFVYAIYILRKLDTAAKLRKSTLGKTPFRFMIVDFFSLILLVQLPFNFLSFEVGDGGMIVAAFFAFCAVALVWLTTIKTVSQAGIVTFGWRALVSMILIPTMYVGSFYFGIASINLLFSEQKSSEAIVWLVVSLLGMIASPWIVRGALKSAVQNPTVEPVSEVSDPFAD